MTPSQLARLRAIEAKHETLVAFLESLERSWNACDQSLDYRRAACISTSVAVSTFAKGFGLSTFAIERINDLHVALGELEAGRTSALLSRAKLPTRTLAASDLAQQAIAQVCVDLYRAAGLAAYEAHSRTARMFLRTGFKTFGVSKIKALGVRLTGAGATLDPAYSFYAMGKELVQGHFIAKRGVSGPLNEHEVDAVALRLISLAKTRDHRLAA